MARIKFFYNNLWDGITDIVPLSEHSNFPAENTQNRDFNHPWQSRNGASSAWGYFAIAASVNDRIDFDEGGGELTANLTPAVYTADSLAAHLKTIMDAAGAHTYTVEYLETGASVNKFKITDGTGTVALPWLTGTNTARSVGDTIGFDVTADDGAAASHTADYVRIHTDEYLVGDLGSAKIISAAIIRGHNLQSGATLQLQGHTADVWTSPDAAENMTYGADLMGIIDNAYDALRWWRLYYADIDNADGYIWNGRIFLGDGFQPATNFSNQPHSRTPIDPSLMKESEGGQEASIQLPHFDTWTYSFRVKGSTEMGYFKAMFDEVGTSKGLFIAEDPDNFPADCYYCRFVDWNWSVIRYSTDYWELSITVKELR